MWPFMKRKQAPADLPLTKAEREHAAQARRQQQAAQAMGRHYVDWVETVKELKRQGKYEEAEKILLACVAATERESNAASRCGVAPWYYEQLAIVYRKQGRLADEVAILERYARNVHAPGEQRGKLAERLSSARDLQTRQKKAVP